MAKIGSQEVTKIDGQTWLTNRMNGGDYIAAVE